MDLEQRLPYAVCFYTKTLEISDTTRSYADSSQNYISRSLSITFLYWGQCLLNNINETNEYTLICTEQGNKLSKYIILKRNFTITDLSYKIYLEEDFIIRIVKLTAEVNFIRLMKLRSSNQYYVRIQEKCELN